MDIRDFSLNELALAAELLRTGSIRQVARSHNLEPGNLSKLLRRIETGAGMPLAARAQSGITPTEAGHRFLTQIAKLLEHGASLGQESKSGATHQLVGIGAVPFVTTHILTHALAELPRTWAGADARIRLLDLAPDDLLASAIKGACDICFHDTPFDWPRSWATQPVGPLTWRPYVRKEHDKQAGNKKAQAQKISRYIYPVYWSRDGVVYGDDRHPVPLDRRALGIGVSSAEAAVRLIERGDWVGFLPDVVALEPMNLGLIEPVSDGTISERTLLVSVKADTVPSKAFKALAAAVKDRLLHAARQHEPISP